MKAHLIDPKKVVSAYQMICDKGARTSRGYLFNGLQVEQDIDGYTVYVKDNAVTMTVYYHYRYHLDYPNAEALESFQRKLDELLASQ